MRQLTANFFFGLLFYLGIQSSAYALCLPSATLSKVSVGQSITFFANCDAAASSDFVWTVFGKSINTGNSSSLTITAPAGLTGQQIARVTNTGRANDYAISFTVNPKEAASSTSLAPDSTLGLTDFRPPKAPRVPLLNRPTAKPGEIIAPATAGVQSLDINIGGDYRLNKEFVLGALIGTAATNTDLTQNRYKQDVRGYGIVVYGSYVPSSATYIDFAVSASKNNYDLSRPTTINNNVSAKTQGYGLGISATTGYVWRDRAWALSPYIRLEYAQLSAKGYTESGSDAARFSDQSITTEVASLGTDIQYSASTSWGVFIPHVRLEYLNRTKSAGATEAQSVGNNALLTVAQASNKNKNFGSLGIGASAQFGTGKTGFLDFDKTFGNDNIRDQRITSGIKIEF